MSKKEKKSRKTTKPIKSVKKLFISWAGTKSYECAIFFKKMIEERFDIKDGEIFISSELQEGKRPMNEIVNALNMCKVGVFFLTL